MNVSIYYLILGAGVLIASFSQILLKKSANKTYDSVLREYLNPYVIIGYGMMFLSTFCSIFAYKKVDYKNGPVIESLGFFFVMILSFWFFGEKITKKKLLGNLIILAGIVIFYL